MIVIPGLTSSLAGVGKRIIEWHEENERLFVEATSSTRWAECPKCSRRSDQVHGRYHRQLDDQPCFGHPVTISIEVRRFKCGNANCKQRTFSERLGTFASTGHRRTRGFNEALRSLGYALGGAAAARLAARLGMRISDDTVLRELRRAGCQPPETAPVVVGIDDWAMARGHRYGTIIVDLQLRRPIELIGNRETSMVADWLLRHPTVTVVARDRAGAYSDAVQSAAPAAQQVADRWHLLSNLREVVERLLMRQSAKLREAARLVGQALYVGREPLRADNGAKVLALTIWQRLGIDRRAARLALYEEAVRRHNLGETFKAIGRAMNLDQRTISNFIRSGSFPERAQRTRGYQMLDAHREYVDFRTAEGCVSATRVWHELQGQGFAGSRNTVRNEMARTRATAQQPHGSPTGVERFARPSPGRAYAWLVGWDDRGNHERKHSDHKRFVDTLCRIEPSIAIAGHMARHFLGLVHRRDVIGFDGWLARARSCGVPELRRFAVGLKGDLSAVRAAFESVWSSGQVEGQVNRLKFLKRQMYGRASLDLLRIRTLHPN